jgi:transcriptional regulator with XRE-family HTH domain
MRAPTVAANSLLALLVDTPLLYRRMAASASSPSKVPMTDRLAALRLQVVATEMSVRIGNRIRQRREELGIKTQRELANLIPIDSVTNQTVNKWEKGVHEPGPQYKMLLAQALQVDVAYFIAEEPQGATPNPFPPANGGDDRLARIETALEALRQEREQGIRSPARPISSASLSRSLPSSLCIAVAPVLRPVPVRWTRLLLAGRC